MYRLTVVYANKKGGHFDFDYYVNKHLPLVNPLIGDSIIKTVVGKGVKGVAGGQAPYTAVVQIYLKNLDGLEAAFENHGEEIMADVPKFTNIEPVLNLEEIFQVKEFLSDT